MKGKNSKRERKGLILLLVPFFVTLLLPGCAAVRTLMKGPPLTADRIEAILSDIDDQQARVSSFYAIGKVLLKDGILEAEADALIVGTRDPFRLKIELTHSWGKPLLHILVDRDRLKVLSFRDRKLYAGTLTPDALSRFLPGELDISMIWAALRGYPAVLQSKHIISREADRVLVVDDKGTELQSLDLRKGKNTPIKVRFALQGVKATYRSYQSDGEIRYAREVRVEHPESNKSLILIRKKTVFNKTIPEAIFSLKEPPHFDEAGLEEMR